MSDWTEHIINDVKDALALGGAERVFIAGLSANVFSDEIRLNEQFCFWNKESALPLEIPSTVRVVLSSDAIDKETQRLISEQTRATAYPIPIPINQLKGILRKGMEKMAPPTNEIPATAQSEENKATELVVETPADQAMGSAEFIRNYADFDVEDPAAEIIRLTELAAELKINYSHPATLSGTYYRERKKRRVDSSPTVEPAQERGEEYSAPTTNEIRKLDSLEILLSHLKSIQESARLAIQIIRELEKSSKKNQKSAEAETLDRIRAFLENADRESGESEEE